MKKLINRIMLMALIASGILTVASIDGCKQDHITFSTTSVDNIYTYLKQDKDFSMFTEIVDKAGYAGLLNTYGSYTIFASNNAGVEAYLKAQGKASVADIDAATAKAIVSISLIANDTINTTLFTDGKMRTPTTANQYLITSVVNTGGSSAVVINKQANLVKGNTHLGNGILHTIGNVLLPATLTIAQTIEKNPKYTIFTEALKETGFYDTLNVAGKEYTVIAQSDSVFNVAGFANYAAVKARYSTVNDPKNHTDSLWLFVANRIWSELSYLSDVATNNLHRTLAPNEQTSSKLLVQTVRINYDLVSGIQEPGQELMRPASDITATNGVIHSVATNYTIVVRLPAPVYFDFCDQPEINKIKSSTLFSRNVQFNEGQLQNVRIFGNNNGAYVEYHTDAKVPSGFYWKNDWMVVGLRFRQSNNGATGAEFTTPVIVKGRYKVWLDFHPGHGGAQSVIASFNGQTMPNLVGTSDGLSASETPAQAEVRGFKSYSDSPDARGNGHVGRLLGVVNVTTTGPQTIRFDATAISSSNAQFWVDALEFRPIDMNQLSPRLGHNPDLEGSFVP